MCFVLKFCALNEVRRLIQKLFFLLASFLLFANMALAQTVTVNGVGADKETAVRDAMRNAVETVVGTMIDSRTLIDKNVVALDEIYSKSQGFVKDIKILQESQSGGMYRVQASVDVNTNPDTQLMNRLQMIMLLNDPRIAVVVLRENHSAAVPSYDENGNIIGMQGNSGNGTDKITETALNEKLLELGFSHVVDADTVTRLYDLPVLRSIYNGENSSFNHNGNLGIDYLVLGKSETDAQKISLPDDKGNYVETMLTGTKSNLHVKIIKFATGELVGTFSVEGQGIENNTNRADNKALKDAAAKAAKKLEEKFRKLGAQPFTGMRMTVSANDYTNVEKLMQELRAISGVQNVYVRERNGNKTILDVDTTQKPHIIVNSLRQRSKLGVFVENMSNDSVELVVS